MSEQPPFHRPPDLPELLQSERERPDPPLEAKARVRELMRQSIAEEAGDGSSDNLRLAPKAAGSFMGWLFAYAPLALAGLGATGFFALGAYLAVHPSALDALTAAWRQPAPAHIAPAAPSVPQPPVSGQPPTRHAATGSGLNRAVPAPSPADPSDATHAAASLEGRLIEQARRALRAGQNASALRSLAEAEQVENVLEQGAYVGAAMPDGSLAEQREALTVLALSRSGSVAEAKRQLAKFTARHPQSFYVSQLQDELKSNEGDSNR